MPPEVEGDMKMNGGEKTRFCMLAVCDGEATWISSGGQRPAGGRKKGRPGNERDHFFEVTRPSPTPYSVSILHLVFSPLVSLPFLWLFAQ